MNKVRITTHISNLRSHSFINTRGGIYEIKKISGHKMIKRPCNSTNKGICQIFRYSNIPKIMKAILLLKSMLSKTTFRCVAWSNLNLFDKRTDINRNRHSINEAYKVWPKNKDQINQNFANTDKNDLKTLKDISK